MKQRCLNKEHPAFEHYAGRGITIDPAWIDDFEAFYAHMGPMPEGDFSIDRIDNNRSYVPGNCRWADRAVQQFNKRANKNSASKVRGVRANREGGWLATLTFRNEVILNQLFDSIGDAIAARRDAEKIVEALLSLEV
jgi:hypothetical protein